MSLDPRPGRPSEMFPGAYRGVVEDVDDPQLRKRYRVRVTNVHPAAVEAQHLPWAELVPPFGGQTFGDIPAYELDDEVWIMFEGGNRRFPIIIGGILNFAGGLTPIPPEQTGDNYVETQKRWVRVDRVGNKIEMSPLDEELWVKISSPDGSFVQVSAVDGAVVLSGEGIVKIQAPNVQIIASEEMNISTPKLIADVTDECTIRGGDIVNVRSANVINIGEYQPPGTIPPPVETTTTINIKAVALVKIESADVIDVDAAGAMTVDVVGKLSITGSADMDVVIEGNALLDVEGNVVADIEGTLTANTKGKILIEGQADIEVNAQSNFIITSGANFDINCGVNFALHAGAAMAIDADATLTIDAAANLEITCSGALSISAQAQLTLEAPIISIEASSLLDMSGTSLAQLDGGVVLLG